MAAFSRKTYYALKALMLLQEGRTRWPLALREVAAMGDIPLKFLEQIMMALRPAGFVASEKGPRGGYSLTRGADQISLQAVLEAVDGRGPRGRDGNGFGHDPHGLAIARVVRDAEQAAHLVLSAKTLSDLLEASRVLESERRAAMYHI